MRKKHVLWVGLTLAMGLLMVRCASDLDSKVRMNEFGTDLRKMEEKNIISSDMKNFLFSFIGTSDSFGSITMVDSGMTYRQNIARAVEFAAILDTAISLKCTQTELLGDTSKASDCKIRMHFSLLNKSKQDLTVKDGTIQVDYPNDDRSFFRNFIEMEYLVKANGFVDVDPIDVKCYTLADTMINRDLIQIVPDIPKAAKIDFQFSRLKISPVQWIWRFPYYENWPRIKAELEHL